MKNLQDRYEIGCFSGPPTNQTIEVKNNPVIYQAHIRDFADDDLKISRTFVIPGSASLRLFLENLKRPLLSLQASGTIVEPDEEDAFDFRKTWRIRKIWDANHPDLSQIGIYVFEKDDGKILCEPNLNLDPNKLIDFRLVWDSQSEIKSKRSNPSH